MILFRAILSAVAVISSVCAFAPSKGAPARISNTQLNIFGDALKGAFSNDDSLGKAKNAGLTSGPNVNDAVTINGKPVNAIVGQKVSQVAAAARVKIPYSCKNGDCGTCMIKMNGRKVKACQMTIPGGKCAIVTD
mmetsp:Transcript_37234/g.81066  ORF Transcript_37234/g.81066 Transcript_37234/m.81066 type:complete len:135 (-) Transcript_37234:579-983(-)